jgi:hypothetical protein
VANGYYNASNLLKYINSLNGVGQIYNYNGEFIFSNAPVGTSGNTVTLTPRLTIASTGAATFSSGIATLGYTASTTYAALFNGSVGIGTASPGVSLDVSGSGIRITNATPTVYFNNTAVQWKAYIPTSTNNFALNDAVRDVLTLGYNGAASFFQGCNVGIGTAAPSALLHVSQSAANTQLRIGNNSAYDQFIYFNGNNDWSIGMDYSNSNAFVISNNSSLGTNDRFVLTTSGNLGIGTTSPAYKLQVGDLANTSGVKNDIFITGDTVNTDGYYSRLIFGNSSQSGGSTASIRGERKTSNYGTELTFYTNEGASAGNGVERLRIASTGAATFSTGAEAVITWARTSCKNWALASDSAGAYFKNTTDSVIPIYMTNAGNVLIGTTTDAGYKLDVNGTGRFSGNLTLAASVVGLVLNDTSGSAAGSVIFQNNGTQKWNLTTLATSNNFALWNNGGTNSYNLQIVHSTGAATFSSSVTAGQGTFAVSSGDNLILEKPTGAYLSFKNGATIRGSINGNNGTDGLNLNYGASHTTALAISSTGVATFSGSINANAGLAMGGQILAFDQSGTRSWSVQATGGNLRFQSGDNLGAFSFGSNVLIGTTTDNGYKLQVAGGSTISGQFIQGGGSGRASNGTTVAFTYNTAFSANTDSADGGRFLSIVNESTVTDAYSALSFRVNPNNGGGGTNAMLDMKFVNANSSNASTLYWSFLTSGGFFDRMSLTSGGVLTAASFFESSDSRLKTLIQDNYQTKGIASITPKLYTKNGKVELGYYAQDFVGVLDSAVSKGSDEMLSLSYREVLVAKVYALEQEIKELKAKLN